MTAPKVFYDALLSYTGMKLALSWSEEVDASAWHADFSGKRVLIIGSGPSIDHVEAEYFYKFDTIIYINHAISNKIHSKISYFFSTDLPRVQGVLRDFPDDVLAIDEARRVIYLSFVRLSAGMLKARGLFRFKAHPRYEFVRWRVPGDRMWPAYYQPERASDAAVRRWIDGDPSMTRMPARGGSSAFGAMLFAARHRPTEIRLIGVDLNDGRSRALSGVAGKAVFGNWARERFEDLARILRDGGVPVVNDSWTVSGSDA